MSSYDPYDPYRDDPRDRSYDPNSPYGQEPPWDPYGDAGGRQVDQEDTRPPGWAPADQPPSPFQMPPPSPAAGQSDAGYTQAFEPFDTPGFQPPPGGYGPQDAVPDRYAPPADPNTTQAYPGPEDTQPPSAGDPSFWRGPEEQPGPPQPDARDPFGGGYWDRPPEAPTGYEGAQDAYRDSPWDRSGTSYAESPYESPYDAPHTDHPFDIPRGDAGSAYSGAYSDPLSDPSYGSRYADSYGDRYTDAYGQSPAPSEPSDYAGYRDHPGYLDYPGLAGSPDPGYAASPDATQAYAMPFDAPEPMDTPPEGYGPRHGGYADHGTDPYTGEPTDTPPAGFAGPAAAPGAFPGSAPPDAVFPGAIPGAPGSMPDAAPESSRFDDWGADDWRGRNHAEGGPADPYQASAATYPGTEAPGVPPPDRGGNEFGDAARFGEPDHGAPGAHGGYDLASQYEAEPPVPRRVDLPDEVLSPLGTGGRRLTDEDGEPISGAEAEPYGRAGGADTASGRRARAQQTRSSETEQGDMPATIGIWVGVVVGLGLAAAAGLGVGLPSLLGTLGATVVAWTLTTVLARRGLGQDHWVAGLVGVIPAALVLASSIAPDAVRTVTVLYLAASAGAAAVALTKPVRRLSELVLEYVVAVGVAFAGGGAVAGVLDGEPIGVGMPSLAIALGFGLALAVASRAHARLASVAASRNDMFVYAGMVVAATVGAASLAVLLGSGEGTLGSLAESVEDVILDFRLIVIIPLALLGTAVVVRAFTPAGWWVSAIAALATTAMASAFAGTNPERRVDVAPTLASSFVGYVLGFLVTVGVAFLIGLRMRSAAARRGRGKSSSRYVDEPGRLGTF